MPTEQLILRRVFPVPVTFADLRRAHASLWYANGASMDIPLAMQVNGIRLHCVKDCADSGVALGWHAAIKEATGALDEVYAVIDGHEVRVATVDKTGNNIMFRAGTNIDRALGDLLIKADEAGYWQRPHEVRHDIEEPQMSHKTMARIAANSFVVSSAIGAMVGKTPTGSK